MKRSQFLHGSLSAAAIVVLVGGSPVFGGTSFGGTSFAGQMTSTPSRTATAAMRVIELPSLPGYPETRQMSLNNHGITVGYAMDYPTTRAVRWSPDGKLTELPGIGGSSTAVQVNDRGAVIGHVSTPSGRQFPARWDARGRLTVLPSLPDHRITEVSAINDNGIAVGVAYEESSYYGPHRPVRWDSKGRITELPLPPGYPYGTATLINKPGMVVGTASKQLGDEDLEAVRWDSKGNVRVLETLGGPTSWVSGINNRGIMVGRADWAPYRAAPVRWDSDGRVTELPTLPERRYAYVSDLTERGVAVGVADLGPPFSVALRWDRNGKVSELPALSGGAGAAALAINGRGVPVGQVLMGDYSFQPVIWDRFGKPWKLPTPDGYQSAGARFINEHGVIVGAGTGQDVRDGALLWVPA